MKKLILFTLIICAFSIISCNTTQEARVCPMWNQKFVPNKCDTIK